MAVAHGDISSDLLVKNLPRRFTDDDKESLLQYFGAQHVVCMGARGKMVRNCLFDEIFEDKAICTKSMNIYFMPYFCSVMRRMQRLRIFHRPSRYVCKTAEF